MCTTITARREGGTATETNVPSGSVEIETGDGTKRRFGVGDVLLADDTTGEGHISRGVDTPREQVFIVVPDDLDLTKWRK